MALSTGNFETREELVEFLLANKGQSITKLAKACGVTWSTAKHILSSPTKKKKVLATEDIQGAIKTCLNCTLSECSPGSKECPYNQKYTGTFSVHQQKTCGYEDKPEVLNATEMNKACDRLISKMGIKINGDDFTGDYFR